MPIAIKIDDRSGRQAPTLHVNLPNRASVFVKAIDHAGLGNQTDIRPAIQIEIAD